jgi:opacity protein-like surface antigen
MKKILVGLLIIALVGLFGNAFGKIGLNIHGGWNALMPMGDFADTNKFSFMGFGGGATINITPMIGIDADFTYQLDIPYKDATQDILSEDAKLSMMYMNAGARINLITGGAFVPYAGGGFGYYMAKYKPHEGDTESDNNIGFYFGGGIDYYFTPKVGIEAGAKFHYVMVGDDDEDESLQEEESNKLMFLTFGAGISFIAL